MFQVGDKIRPKAENFNGSSDWYKVKYIIVVNKNHREYRLNYIYSDDKQAENMPFFRSFIDPNFELDTISINQNLLKEALGIKNK